MSFKVGDWVQHKYLNTIFQVKDIFKDGYLDCITSLKLEPRIKWDSCLFQGKYNSDDCVLWQPKEGEWCWYKHCLVKVLSIRDTSYQVSAPMFGEQWAGSIELEPFTNQLPTYIKDK